MEDSYINKLPNEILLYIFKFLTVKEILISRQVCKRWKQLLEVLIADDSDWERFCNLEFTQNCRDVKLKSPEELDFFDVYKSLSLWERLDIAKDAIDEFCNSTRFQDEIRSINVLRQGLIMVHRQDGCVYHDINTQESVQRDRIYGDFCKVVEIDNTIITHNGFLHLTILKRTGTKTQELKIEKVFNNIKYFVILNNNVYFINLRNQIFSYGITKKDNMAATVSQYNSDSQRAITLSIIKGQLHGLWIDRTVRVYLNNEFVTLFSLDNEPNITHTLWKYNFIETMDWRTYHNWMCELQQPMPIGLNYINTFHIYGDTFLIGSNSGILKIYYKPFINEKLDLFNSKPVKEYNFCYRIDIPVLSIEPILKIEVVEVRNGHKVLVAMPKKIVVINFIYDAQFQVSKALIPYMDWKGVIFKMV